MIEINEKKCIKLEVVLIELRKNVFKRVYLDRFIGRCVTLKQII